MDDDELIFDDFEKAKARRRRGHDEECKIPDKFYAKFFSAPHGCLRLEFSNNGVYLAAACSELNSRTFIKIFEV